VTRGFALGAKDFLTGRDGRERKIHVAPFPVSVIYPAGQFLYIEHATGQPIAAALAQSLLRMDVPLTERRAILEVPMPVSV
jgi:hypothetical protein